MVQRDGSIPFAARGDDLAAALAMFPTSVAILSVFDTCFAGEMVDGSKDIKRGSVAGTAGRDVCAPRDASVFLGTWNHAFTYTEQGSIATDKNNDRKLTMGELAGFMKAAFENPLAPYRDKRPFVEIFEGADHLGRTVVDVPRKTALVPAPSTLGLLAAAGVVLLARARARCRRRPARPAPPRLNAQPAPTPRARKRP